MIAEAVQDPPGVVLGLRDDPEVDRAVGHVQGKIEKPLKFETSNKQGNNF